MDVNRIRSSFRAYQEAHRAGWALKPIAHFGAQKFIVLSNVKPMSELQKLDVVPIQELDNLARFAGVWPEKNKMNGVTHQVGRDYALVMESDEGDVFVLTEGGLPHRVAPMALTIQLILASSKQVRNEQPPLRGPGQQ